MFHVIPTSERIPNAVLEGYLMELVLCRGLLCVDSGGEGSFSMTGSLYAHRRFSARLLATKTMFAVVAMATASQHAPVCVIWKQTMF